MKQDSRNLLYADFSTTYCLLSTIWSPSYTYLYILFWPQQNYNRVFLYLYIHPTILCHRTCRKFMLMKPTFLKPWDLSKSSALEANFIRLSLNIRKRRVYEKHSLMNPKKFKYLPYSNNGLYSSRTSNPQNTMLNVLNHPYWMKFQVKETTLSFWKTMLPYNLWKMLLSKPTKPPKPKGKIESENSQECK